MNIRSTGLPGAVLAAALALAAVPAAAQPVPGQVIGAPQLDRQKAFIEQYAKAHPDAVRLPTGVVYRVLRPGKPGSPKPRITDQVRVHYEGKLIDGRVFDSSYRRDETSLFHLPKLIKAWQDTIPLMSIGEKIEMVVPSEQGYGSKGSEDIPPNATLVFTMELFEALPGPVLR
ncbi:MAG TPA: FKBP-type peptidyl-prolyl cis-trans isomerase [Azospirillaceae bacterium]|nr:FKBP-type peptidyl-prolyl cis-trans isomerase [Azospirillaceae bacterium]